MVNNFLDVFYTYCIACTLMQMVNIILVQRLFSPSEYLACFSGFCFEVEFFNSQSFGFEFQ